MSNGAPCCTESANENAQSSLLGSCVVSPSCPPLLSAHLLREFCIWLPSSGRWGWQEVQLKLALSIGLQHPARNQVDWEKKKNQTKHPKWVLKESNIHFPVGWTFSAGKGSLLWSLTLGAPGNNVNDVFLWVNSRMWLWGTGSGKSENLGTENPSQTWQWGNSRIEQHMGRRLAAHTCSPAAAQTVSETKDQTWAITQGSPGTWPPPSSSWAHFNYFMGWYSGWVCQVGWRWNPFHSTR